MTVTARTTFQISGPKITINDLKELMAKIDSLPDAVDGSSKVTFSGIAGDQRDGPWYTVSVTI